MYTVSKDAKTRPKLDQGWFHVVGSGRHSHFYEKGGDSAICGYKIFSSDLLKIKSGKIPLFKESEIFKSWMCKRCKRYLT